LWTKFIIAKVLPSSKVTPIYREFGKITIVNIFLTIVRFDSFFLLRLSSFVLIDIEDYIKCYLHAKFNANFYLKKLYDT